MAISSSAINVSTTAVLLAKADADGTEVVIYHPSGASGQTIEVGPADVTTATGLPIASGASLSFRLRPHEEVYGIADTGTHEVRVMTL